MATNIMKLPIQQLVKHRERIAEHRFDVEIKLNVLAEELIRLDDKLGLCDDLLIEKGELGSI